jgi:hypothetical protein
VYVTLRYVHYVRGTFPPMPALLYTASLSVTQPHIISLHLSDLYEPTKSNLNGQSKVALNDKSRTSVALVTFCCVLQELRGI